MIRGLSAFPLTPLRDDEIDERAYAGLVERLAAAGVDSITALGSTGSYAYLTLEERRRAARIALAHAGDVTVLVGVGALRTAHVVALARDAEQLGAAGLLVAPVSYQPLTDDDVLGLYEDLAAAVALPIVVYDNPGTTRFRFSDELYGRVAALPTVTSIKIPAVPAEPSAARARIDAIRAAVPERVGIGISGDAAAATALVAGCDAWYSVIAGTAPAPAVAITRAALAGDAEGALAESRRLQPLWDLFAAYGSVRVVAAIAELAGLAARSSLPRPLVGLDEVDRRRVDAVVRELDLLPHET
ncbi:dihydrodipicolinate synthase family protein [Amnibacterium sp. CER49]|uniref:dihydrodipicolinate synthase family protein n=1 Tax=Amnibacterium sp. CER49 TaxID=3039161 RepID=UPI0024487893|nr:dihydrodipicolinate synthase family protein [Amnibacterium sp. CER49]MDH2443360.1 dihydrodipicolinate synthase family protein [Amnibacterium sp. CER49]